LQISSRVHHHARRRHPSIEFDPYIYHASLIYSDTAIQTLEGIHREYIDVAQKYRLPIFMLTDTWRANGEELNVSNFKDRRNQDNVHFLRGSRDSYEFAQPIFSAGNWSARDAYKPEEALSKVRKLFHVHQLSASAEAGVDFLYVATPPCFIRSGGHCCRHVCNPVYLIC